MRKSIWLAAFLLLLPVLALAQPPAAARAGGDPPPALSRHLQGLVAFVYGGDIWLVGAKGGAARRLTSSVQKPS